MKKGLPKKVMVAAAKRLYRSVDQNMSYLYTNHSSVDSL